MQEAAHLALNTDYGLAMQVEQCGETLVDYHTVQVAPTGAYPTRRAELAAPEASTEQSWRHYHTDMFNPILAVWPRDPHTARWNLADIGSAMERPHYQPYFGRMSCPLSGRLNPVVVAAADPVAALTWRAANDSGLRALGRPPLTRPVVTLDAADAQRFGLSYQRVRTAP